MFTIGNNLLTVTLLDPVKDRDRFGTRYCTGGYIFQIADSEKGDLMSGPTFPESFNVFDGQGIPDAFNQVPLLPRGKAGSEALILGIGLCDLAQDRVVEFCGWETTLQTDRAEFRTTHRTLGFEVDLVRRVSVLGRTVRSWTSVTNRGESFLPVCWFPHPFFPQPSGTELCAFNLPVSFPANPGYRLNENNFIHRNGPPVTPGPFLALDHGNGSLLAVLQRHDLLGLVGARCDYVPAAFPIWGNARTFSWEPYFERSLFPGQSTSWTIDYDF